MSVLIDSSVPTQRSRKREWNDSIPPTFHFGLTRMPPVNIGINMESWFLGRGYTSAAGTQDPVRGSRALSRVPAGFLSPSCRCARSSTRRITAVAPVSPGMLLLLLRLARPYRGSPRGLWPLPSRCASTPAVSISIASFWSLALSGSAVIPPNGGTPRNSATRGGEGGSDDRRPSSISRPVLHAYAPDGTGCTKGVLST